MFIVITATRIGIIIYFVFLFNIIVKLDLKKRIAINALIYIVFTVFLLGNIHKTDEISGDLFLVMGPGERYEGQTGQKDYKIIEFEQHGILIEKKSEETRNRPP